MRGVKYLALAKNVCWSLSLVMLCRTSKCGESPTVDAVDKTADAA